MTGWCKSQKQFRSLVNNMTWADFESLRTENPRGMDEGGTAAILKTLETKRLEHLRKTGKCGPNRSYGTYLSNLTVTHKSTFRTEVEKQDGGPRGTGPFTRNFAIQVDKQPALWEIHVHYANNGTRQKAHAKLITQRTTHEHIADLATTSALVNACKVLAATDAKARAEADW